MYKNYSEDILTALEACKGARSICRGWPESFELLPCIAVSEASNQVERFYSTDEYILEAEYYVRLFTKKAKEGDSLAIEVEELLKGIGFDRTFTYEDDNENIRQRLMRFRIRE